MSAIDRTLPVRLNTTGRELFWQGGDEDAICTIGDLADLIAESGDGAPSDLACDGYRVTMPGPHEYSERVLIGEVAR